MFGFRRFTGVTGWAAGDFGVICRGAGDNFGVCKGRGARGNGAKIVEWETLGKPTRQFSRKQ